MTAVEKIELGDNHAGDESSPLATKIAPDRLIVYIVRGLVALAIVYAFLAGFRTVYDLDLGWQLATGRWVVQHHQIPKTDVFSYTASGKPWTYPVFSGVTFYFLYTLGEYAALSWLTATAMALTSFLLTRKRTLGSAILAIIAVPVLAHRITPRADLFSTVLFAAMLALLWHHHREGVGPLWLLPFLFCAWANLHLGFAAGLMLCVAYVVIEAAELPFAGRRAFAIHRLKRAWPWLLAGFAAILVNPWGPRILVALVRQQQAMQTHSLLIREWAGLRLSWTMFQNAFAWRQPEGALYWLLAAALLAVVAAAYTRNVGAALLLLGSVILTIRHYRFEGVFAAIVVVVGGSMLSDAFTALRTSNSTSRLRPVLVAATIALGLLATGLVTFRAYDLVSNRLYLTTSNEALFGAGLSWWFPERAAAFVQREHLPENIFNNYDLGGYLTWRLPGYPVYIDGRAIPFGEQQLKFAVSELPSQPPDSPIWQQEAEARGINTIIVSIAGGVSQFPNFRAFCQSQSWRPVYLDEVSAVFLRRTPETQQLIERLQINCDTATFTPPPSPNPARARADAFNFWLNSAFLYANLDRRSESLQALDRAEALFPDNNNVHFMRAMALMDGNDPKAAEAELRRSLELQPDENTWTTLARLLAAQRRYDDAAQALRAAADLSQNPAELYLGLGRMYLEARQPKPALDAFADAANSGPSVDDSTPQSVEFHAQLSESRAIALWAVGDRTQAIRAQEQAALHTPQNGDRWRQLAAMYQAVGRLAEAQEALARAQ